MPLSMYFYDLEKSLSSSVKQCSLSLVSNGNAIEAFLVFNRTKALKLNHPDLVPTCREIPVNIYGGLVALILLVGNGDILDKDINTVVDYFKYKFNCNKLLENAHDPITGFPVIGGLIKGLLRGASNGGSSVVTVSIKCYQHVNASMGIKKGYELLKELVYMLWCMNKAYGVYQISGTTFCFLYFGKSELEIKEIIVKNKVLTENFLINKTDSEIVNAYVVGNINDKHIAPEKFICNIEETITRENDGEVVFFNRDIYSPSNECLNVLEVGINALKNKQIGYIYEPMVNLKDNKPYAYEALMRFNCKEDVRPYDVVIKAEKHNLIIQFDINTVKEVFIAINKNIHERISLNLSMRSMVNDKFISEFIHLHVNNFVDASRIFIELTESWCGANSKVLHQNIKILRSRGFTFLLDDFGSGNHSYEHFLNLPVDIIKIDGSLIRQIENNPIVRSIVESINNTAHEMGKKTVAEHIETKEQLDLTKLMGIDYGQGFYFKEKQQIVKI